MPYLISCPYSESTPSSVSLVEHPCDEAENNLEIINPQPENGVKKRFGVCSKQVTYEKREFTIKFIEWVHLLRLLGAEKVHISFEYLHPDFFDVADYLKDEGFIEYYPFYDPSGLWDSRRDSWQTCMLEVNILTDCFYRNKNLYDFIVVIDVDEVIIPVNETDMTWEDMVTRVNASVYIDAYVTQNVGFPSVKVPPHSEVPEYMYMLQHTLRTQNFTPPGFSVKSFFGTERVLTVHNHMPHHCLQDHLGCQYLDFPYSVGQNSHFRVIDGYFHEDMTTLVYDNKTWKFKDPLIKAVQKTLRETGFNP